MFKGNISLDEVKAYLLQQGIEYNPHIDVRNTYKKQYKNRPADFNKHLKLGTSRDPKLSFRIHFEYDAEDDVIVINHAGKHLPTTKS
ncbi:hypothetical protein MBAV_000804 [Candidatus Magnetobacterium bavaricum]|uniref:Uncharacterized protein n=1 Tax=Candidatus Magnetobacterium bavaricum TaxID=29290 RepID=A0A0F3GYT5_9BACT|nr:hypothetical protein MBAV_000804 [Candidatus Magnetobacterium bavaricum]